jgi:hypothetical protein
LSKIGAKTTKIGAKQNGRLRIKRVKKYIYNIENGPAKNGNDRAQFGPLMKDLSPAQI